MRKSDYEREPTRDARTPKKQRRPATYALYVGLLACTAGYACTTQSAKTSITVPDPTPPDASQRDPGGSVDASSDAASLGPHIRGPTPEWPEAEQEVELPYRADAASVELDLSAQPSKLDLHFNVDTTLSFGGEIDAIQTELSRTIIPRVAARVADTQFGVSRFADFPVVPFGTPPSRGLRGDMPYELLTVITDRLAKVTKAVNSLDNPLGQGGDIPEAGAEALYQIATGVGYTREKEQLIAPFDRDAAAADGGGTLGGVGFRERALRVVVHITDAPSHTPGEYAQRDVLDTHSMSDAGKALRALGARVIGICTASSADPSYKRVRDELGTLALATGARSDPVRGVCDMGVKGAALEPVDDQCPFVFDASPDGTGLANSIVDSVVSLLDSVHLSEVHAEPGQDPLGFIQRIEVAPARQASGVAPLNTADRLPAGKPDGVPDSYLNVDQAQRLGFRVVLGNPRIAPSDLEQRFRVSVRLVGDGLLLEERFLRVVVPPQLRAADRDD